MELGCCMCTTSRVSYTVLMTLTPHHSMERMGEVKAQARSRLHQYFPSLEISAGGKDMFVSAEAFDKSADDGLNALAAYLSIFDETIEIERGLLVR